MFYEPGSVGARGDARRTAEAPRQTGPTAWMMNRAGNWKPGVMRTSPVGHGATFAQASAGAWAASAPRLD